MDAALGGFTEDYKRFLGAGVTGRSCVRETLLRLETAGFVALGTKRSLKSGDKVYKDIKGRTILALVVGEKPEQLRIIGSHVDAPKLDLKPKPFFEEGRLALCKLHDYGWIKPYQWVNTALELHGLIITKAGKEIELGIGMGEGEPVFVIPDLPPHIAATQMKKPMDEGFSVAQLTALIGCMDGGAGGQGRTALDGVRAILKDEYGIEEGDFSCADLCLVPHQRPRAVGFGSLLVGGYGQDDRSCVYASLQALLEAERPERTAIGFFVDKEEVASVGDTSAQSFALRNFVLEYCEKMNAGAPSSVGGALDADRLLEAAEAISAAVTTGFDPNFSDKFDEANIAFLGSGVAVEKYGAAGAGKFRANEARAEFMHVVRGLLEAESIPWQVGTLARLGVGGGGTIAQFLSRYGMDCVDAGPCLLGMHSPFEIGSAGDIHSSFRLYKAFFSR
jgi:aspartyl aminopeptidase